MMWPGGPTVSEINPSCPPTTPPTPARALPTDVVDGAIDGRQDPARPGYGGYLVSDQAFGDFELGLERNPDWPADTGIMIRPRPNDDWARFPGPGRPPQVRLDRRILRQRHRTASMLYRPSSTPASTRTASRTGGSRKPGDQPRADDTHKARLLRRVSDVQAIVESWRWTDWNHLRITCAGRLP